MNEIPWKHLNLIRTEKKMRKSLTNWKLITAYESNNAIGDRHYGPFSNRWRAQPTNEEI